MANRLLDSFNAKGGGTSTSTPTSSRLTSEFEDWKKKRKPVIDQNASQQAEQSQTPPVSRPVDQIQHEEQKQLEEDSSLGGIVKNTFKGLPEAAKKVSSAIENTLIVNPSEKLADTSIIKGYAEAVPESQSSMGEEMLKKLSWGTKAITGATGGAVDFEKVNEQRKSDDWLDKSLNVLSQGVGMAATLGLGEIGVGATASKIPLLSEIATKYPSFAKYAAPIAKNMISFAGYGQLDPKLANDYNARLKKAGVDTVMSVPYSLLGFIKDFRYSVPASFTVGFGMAKLDGASNKDALIAGGALGLLDLYGRKGGESDTTLFTGKNVAKGGDPVISMFTDKAISDVNKFSDVKITSTSSPEEIARAKRSIAHNTHPDVGGNEADFKAGMAAIEFLTEKSTGKYYRGMQKEQPTNVPNDVPNDVPMTENPAMKDMTIKPEMQPAEVAPETKVSPKVQTLLSSFSENNQPDVEKIATEMTSDELQQALSKLDEAYSVADTETKQTIGKDMEYLTNISSERMNKVHEVAGEVITKKTIENLDNNVENLTPTEVDDVNALLDQVKSKANIELPKVTNATVQVIEKTKTDISELQTQKKELLAKKAEIKQEAPEKAKEIQTAINEVDQEINGMKDFVKAPAIRPEQQSKVPIAGYSEIRKGNDNRFQIFYRGSDKLFSPKTFASQEEARAHLKTNQERVKTLPKETAGGVPITYQENTGNAGEVKNQYNSGDAVTFNGKDYTVLSQKGERVALNDGKGNTIYSTPKELASGKNQGNIFSEIVSENSNFYDQMKKGADKNLPATRKVKDLLKSPLKLRYEKDGYFTFPNKKIESPADVAFAFRELKNEAVEKFYVIGTKNDVPVSIECISVGTMDASLVQPFESADILLRNNVDGAYFVHNHPSGEIEPSNEDVEVTKRLKNGYKNLGIEFKGHVIIDTTKFGLISDKVGSFKIDQMTEAKNPTEYSAYKKYVEWLTNKPEDFKILAPKDAASISKGLNIDKKDNTLAIFVNSRMSTQIAQFIPKDQLTVKNIVKIGSSARAKGVFIVNHGLDPYKVRELSKDLKVLGMELTDAVSINSTGFSSAMERGDLYVNDKQDIKSQMPAMTDQSNKGAGLFLEKMERETLRGELSKEDLAQIETFVKSIKKNLDDVSLKIYQNGEAQGIFEYSQAVMTLFRDNIKNKDTGFKRVVIHELWHTLSRYLPKEDLAGIEAQFKAEQRAFFNANPEYEVSSKIKDNNERMKAFAGSVETYKFFSLDEWFAETMIEKTLPEIAEKYGKDSFITRLFNHIASILKAMYDAIMKSKGGDYADKVFKDFMSGKNKQMNFQYGLDYYTEVQRNEYHTETGEAYNITSQMPKLPEMRIKNVPLEDINIDEEVFTAVKDVEGGRKSESYLPILLKQRADGSYDVMDGRHRLASEMREGKRSFLAMTDEALYRQYSDKEEMAKNNGSIMVQAYERSGYPVAGYQRRVASYMPDVTNTKDLTTPILEQLKGKEVVSKQFIEDLAKRQETKQVERDLINKVLVEFEGKVDVKKFIEKINSRLLPLKVIDSDTYANYGMDNIGMDYDSSLNPPKTHIYDSPFKHGKTGHFSSDFKLRGYNWENKNNKIQIYINEIPEIELPAPETGDYNKLNDIAEKWIKENRPELLGEKSGLFGHTRAADDEENGRYILEIQSDVFQGDKSGAILPSEIKKQIEGLKQSAKQTEVSSSDPEIQQSSKNTIKHYEGQIAELETKLSEMQKNDQLMMFNNYKNTWHERLIREEIARAVKDDVKALRFPTPHTVSKIEGYIGDSAPYELLDNGTELGDRIDYGGETMVVVKHYGDESFQAVPEEAMLKFYQGEQFTVNWKTLAEEDAESLAEEAQYEWNNFDPKVQTGFEAHERTKKLEKISDDANAETREILDVMYEEDDNFENAMEIWKRKKIENFDVEEHFDNQGYNVEIDDQTVVAWNRDFSPETFDSPESYKASNKTASEFDYETDLEQQEQKTVARFYDKQVRKYLEKIRKGNIVEYTDPNGNNWIETKITKDDQAPVMAFMPDLTKPETETQRLSRIVNEKNTLMKQKRGMEKEYATTKEGGALLTKVDQATQLATEANMAVQQGIKNNPQFKKEGKISDAMGSGWLMQKGDRNIVVEAKRVDTYIERGYEKKIEIDSLASESGFENGEDYLNDQLKRETPVKYETAVKKALTYTSELYRNISEKIKKAETEINKAKQDKNAFFLGMKVGGSVMRGKFKEKMSVYRHRKEKVSAAQDFFKLSDSQFKRIGGRRDVQYMSNEEFDGFMKHIEVQAEREILHANAKMLVVSQIQEKQLKKVDNFRRALKLPPIDKMTTEQLQQFDQALESAQPEDEFLTQRMIETLKFTELKGIKTVREAREILDKKLGENFAKNGVKISPLLDRARWDTPLAESNEFMHLLVQEKDMAFLMADAKTLKAEEEINELVKKSRKSVPRTLTDKLVPEDKEVFEYLEGVSKPELASKMTPEQLELAMWLQSQFEGMRDYLLQNEQLKKYRENYITHIRKDFLEKWKNDGMWEAIKGVFEQQKMDEAKFEILASKTEDIIPFEKWFQFAMQRTGIIDPSQNVMKAFMAYKHSFERKVALDSLIPKIMTYVYSLTPSAMTEKGLVKDESLKKFVTSWLNSKKGRKFDFGGLLKQGSVADSLLLFIRSFTTVLDLGLSIPIGIASNAGEQSANLIFLGSKQYVKGAVRSKTKQGKEIVAKYENFVGKTPWKHLAEGSNHIGNKIMGAMFLLFHSSSVRANKMFLLGAMNDTEFNSGEVSPERLAQMKIDLGRWRVVEGSKSILGNTSIGGVATQYKTWAIVSMRTTVDNIEKLIKNRNFKSREGRETMRQAILMGSIALMILLAFDDDGKDRSFVTTLIRKIVQDSLSAIQALDPTLYITDPRALKFLIDFSSSIKQIIILDEYKTSGAGYSKGDLKGVNKLIRTVKPSILKQIESGF